MAAKPGWIIQMLNMKESTHCLVIDDDLDDQEIFLMCVEEVNPRIICRTANNGAEAIALLETDVEYIPQFIFLDVNMPKMNGLECLKRLQQFSRLKKTKIFMYSTTSESSFVEKAGALGAADFLIKPAKTDTLKEQLEKIFPSPHAVDPA